MKSGYRVEYSDDENQVCVIPDTAIPFEDFIELTKMYRKFGYKWWIPADDRCGYIFTKYKKEIE